ncbi:cytochrome b [Seohaeicola zhoushanensis]|uniref:Cytochrome b562 n=1 Tax=Seohaeicola zhoushanensis TaxID=1569283 RepID=A0A8J3H1L6_9RHOB|nr:cytochrome b/b6 domain-containing protein [Seohaeicola zhoushanensis]GHF65844.1 cytochrome b562 [Seohaeicola zhoushanensis]
MSTAVAYSRLQISLHWLIAILITAAWFISDGMGRALRQRLEAGETGFTGNTVHVWIGSAVFALILLRILVRALQGAPIPMQSSPLLEAAALWGHRLLYALMIAVPGLGALTWYAGVGEAGDVHAVAANALLIVALGHAAVAIWHQLVRRDGTLTRMTRPRA